MDSSQLSVLEWFMLVVIIKAGGEIVHKKCEDRKSAKHEVCVLVRRVSPAETVVASGVPWRTVGIYIYYCTLLPETTTTCTAEGRIMLGIRRTLLRYLFGGHARRRHSGDTVGEDGSDTFDDSHTTHVEAKDDDRCVHLSEVFVHPNVEQDYDQEQIDYWMDKSIQLETEVSRLKALIREQGMIKMYRLSFGGVEFVDITTQPLENIVNAHFQEVLRLREKQVSPSNPPCAQGYTCQSQQSASHPLSALGRGSSWPHNPSSTFGQSHFAAHLLEKCDVALEDVLGWCVNNVRVEILVKEGLEQISSRKFNDSCRESESNLFERHNVNEAMQNPMLHC
jgi:hypothetical protein